MTSSAAATWTLLLLAAAPLPAAGASPAAVRAVHGDVQVQEGARWRPLTAGEALPDGAELRTGPRAGVALSLPRGDALAVGEDAAVRLEAAEAPRVRLSRGELEVTLAAGSPGLLLAGAGADARVRGEEGARVRLGRAGEGVAVAALAGQAQLRVAGAEAVLEAGEGRVVEGGALTEARPLLPVPQPLGPALDARFLCPGLVVRLSWAEVAGAAAYRVEVARDADFLGRVLSVRTGRVHSVFAAPSPSPYFWRVAAVEADGTAGPFSPARALHCEADVPREHLLEPGPQARVRAEPKQPLAVEFRWEALPGASAYRLVLAPTPDLRAPDARTVPVSGTEALVTELAPGPWYWGVWAEGAPERPLFLAPRRLDVAPARSLVKVPTVIGDWGP